MHCQLVTKTREQLERLKTATEPATKSPQTNFFFQRESQNQKLKTLIPFKRAASSYLTFE